MCSRTHPSCRAALRWRTAVPCHTDLDGTVRGAQKYAQLGQDAFEKILDAATQDTVMPDSAFVVFAELNMLFGDMFYAFVEKRGQWNSPTYCFHSHFVGSALRLVEAREARSPQRETPSGDCAGRRVRAIE